ncbi:MAG: ABC transporter substrate-binding protein [Candidatus Nanopelagicales bacterium]
MTRPTLVRSLAVAGASALLLAACGSSGGGDATSSAPAPSESSTFPADDGVLTVGTVLPQTGSLAFLGPPEFAGVDLALKEINDAGGVLGKPVVKIEGDSGDTSTNIASATVDAGLAKGVDAFIGAASSSVSLTIIDKITSAGVVQMSPANTSIALTTYADKGLYWRTAPPDTFQGAILGQLVAGDNHATAAVLALQDAYGEGLAKTFTAAYESTGNKVVFSKIYDPKAADYAAEVTAVKAAKPEALVIIGFDETKKILQELIKQGIGPDNLPLYLCDGNMGNALAEGLPAGTLNGAKGTIPGSKASDAFQSALKAINPDLIDFSYAPESYDAMNLIALAAQAAGNTSGVAIASQLQAVSAGGEKCSTFADCKKLLDEGKDIDYEGQSGPCDFDANGDPTKATMGVYQFGADDKISALDFIPGDVPPSS